MAFLDSIAPPITRSILTRELRLQSELGYKFELTGHPAGWIDGFMLADMTKTWHAAGLAARGLNYFTLGAIEHGLSSRFIPESPYYQAWLGGYLVELESDETWSDQDYFRLPEADQNKWLWHFGDPSAAMRFDPRAATENLPGYGHPAKLIQWHGTTHSDVGARSRRVYARAVMAGMAAMMHQLNPHLTLHGAHFIPPSDSHRPSYTSLPLNGYLAIHDLAPRLKAIFYVCCEGRRITLTDMRKLITQNITTNNPVA